MKKIQTILMGLSGLALLLVAPGNVQNADAGIRVKASVHTPNVHVRIGNTSSKHYRSYKRGYRPVRHDYRVTKRDQRIARRLARYTGVPARKLIRLRRDGYRWFEIGRHLEIRGRVVQAAMYQRSWQRFLRQERRLARCEIEPYAWRGIVYTDGDNYDD